MKFCKRKIFIIPVLLLSLMLNSCDMLEELAAEPIVVVKPIDHGLRLIDAIDYDNLELAKESIESGANINEIHVTPNSKVNPLYLSMSQYSHNIFMSLLEQGADSNYVDKNKFSLLMYAAGARRLGSSADFIASAEYCELLLKYGADVNKVGRNGLTALDYAVRNSQNPDIIKILLENGAEVHLKTLTAAIKIYNHGLCDYWVVKELASRLNKKGIKTGLDPVLQAAILGDSSKVSELVKSSKLKSRHKKNVLFFTAAFGGTDILKLLENTGLSLDTVDSSEYSLLQIAAQNGNLNNVKYLLEQGLDINYTNSINESALILAVENNHYDIVEYLFRQGANIPKPQEEDYYFYTDILSSAAINGNIKMIDLIINSGYDLNNDNIYEAVSDAIIYGQIEPLKYFIEKGLDVNYSPHDYSYTSLLEFACGYWSRGNLEIVTLLVENGADVDGFNDGAPLNAASESGEVEIVRYLLFKGADVNASYTYEDGSKGTSALIQAIIGGHLDIVKLLVENGADTNYSNEVWKGKTPLEIAEESGSKRIYEYLKSRI
jgi:ankyrin repeat protein